MARHSRVRYFTDLDESDLFKSFPHHAHPHHHPHHHLHQHRHHPHTHQRHHATTTSTGTGTGTGTGTTIATTTTKTAIPSTSRPTLHTKQAQRAPVQEQQEEEEEEEQSGLGREQNAPVAVMDTTLPALAAFGNSGSGGGGGGGSTAGTVATTDSTTTSIIPPKSTRAVNTNANTNGLKKPSKNAIFDQVFEPIIPTSKLADMARMRRDGSSSPTHGCCSKSMGADSNGVFASFDTSCLLKSSKACITHDSDPCTRAGASDLSVRKVLGVIEGSTCGEEGKERVKVQHVGLKKTDARREKGVGEGSVVVPVYWERSRERGRASGERGSAQVERGGKKTGYDEGKKEGAGKMWKMPPAPASLFCTSSETSARVRTRDGLGCKETKDAVGDGSGECRRTTTTTTTTTANTTITPTTATKTTTTNTASPLPDSSSIIYLPTQKNLIATGRTSSIYRGTLSLYHPTTPCAIKRPHPDAYSRQRVMGELEVLKRVRGHANVVSLVSWFKEDVDDDDEGDEAQCEARGSSDHAQDRSDRADTADQTRPNPHRTRPQCTCLVLEFAPGGTLWDFMCTKKQAIGKRLWMRWAKQLFSAVGWLKECGVVHLDIKPHNVLLDDLKVAKLSDFGNAVVVDVPMARGREKGKAGPGLGGECATSPSDNDGNDNGNGNDENQDDTDKNDGHLAAPDAISTLGIPRTSPSSLSPVAGRASEDALSDTATCMASSTGTLSGRRSQERLKDTCWDGHGGCGWNAGIGTTAYSPPELLLHGLWCADQDARGVGTGNTTITPTADPLTEAKPKSPSAPLVSFPVDVYSLSVTLWVVGILGHEPFTSVASPAAMTLYISAGFLSSGLNWPDPKHTHMDSPTPPCHAYRHYGSFFGNSRGIYIPGTSSYIRYVNGDRVEPEIVVRLAMGLERDAERRPTAREMVDGFEVIDGCRDHVVNLEL